MDLLYVCQETRWFEFNAHWLLIVNNKNLQNAFYSPSHRHRYTHHTDTRTHARTHARTHTHTHPFTSYDCTAFIAHTHTALVYVLEDTVHGHSDDIRNDCTAFVDVCYKHLKL